MVTTKDIEKIHELIGTREGYGRNRLTASLENRTPEEREVIYNTLRDYSSDLRRLTDEEIVQLTNRVIMGLEHVDKGKPRDLGVYIEIVCFGQPLLEEHFEINGHNTNPHQIHTTQYHGYSTEEID
jgi:hypothetical protein